MADDLAHLDRRIAAAAAALHGARAACWHSPNSDSCRVEAMCENALDELLERRYELQIAEKVVTA